LPPLRAAAADNVPVEHDDIIKALLREVRAIVPEQPTLHWLQFECELRREWAGERVYIKKTATVERERQAKR